MDHYLLVDHWGSIVRDLKDSERETYRIPNYTTEQLARAILTHMETTRFRQAALFTQQRGEEYEQMIAKLEGSGFDREAIARFLGEEEFWKTTTDLGMR